MEIPGSAFADLIDDLTNNPLRVNYYRRQTGVGRSQAFGVVGKRCMPPDASRQNWLRPYTFKLLQDFATKYVDISWNAITVNVNYKAEPHYDRHNIGNSYLVAFGNFSGGELEICNGEYSGLYDVRHKPMIEDFSKVLHSVTPFEGNRFSLVFYWYDLKGTVLPPFTVREVNGSWRFFRGEEMIDREKGLPHPLRKAVG